MTPPVKPERDDATDFLKFLRDSGRREDAQEFERFLRDTGREYAIRNLERRRAFAEGRLQKDVERRNLNEQEAVQAEQEMNVGTPLMRAAGATQSLIRDIPGAEAAAAGLRSLARGQPYTEALGDIRGSQEGLASAPRGALRALGGGMAASAIPGSPAMAGAKYGAALNAASAEPVSGAERGIRTAIGGAAGGALGKFFDVAATAARARMTPTIEQTAKRLKELRSARSAPLYEQAMREGRGLTGTQEIADFLASPDVAPILERLQQSRVMQGVAPDDPRMLDAIYKVLSDRQRQIGRQLASADPSRPNIGRFEAENLNLAKRQAVNAISEAPTAPMPSYALANREFAKGSQALEAAERGYNAVQTRGGTTRAPKNLAKHGPDALMDFIEANIGKNPDVGPAAIQGALGNIRRSTSGAGFQTLNPFAEIRGQTARNALLEGPELVRRIEALMQPTVGRSLRDALQRSAVAGLTPGGDIR